MATPPHSNPLGRFTGLAGNYALYRPDYPPAAIEHILSGCGLGPGALLVDVGCGTGISSRLFAERGLRVVGIEPNDDMRARAEAEPCATGERPRYLPGRAEATGLADGTADAVLAAQAFHWFQPKEALAEFHRILRPSGWVALVWNERDGSDPCTAAYGEVVGASAQARAIEGPRARAADALWTCPLFEEVSRAVFAHAQEVDEDGLLGRAFSASYAPRDPAAAQAYAAALRRVFAWFQHDGRVALRYQTAVTTGRRTPG